MRILSIHNNYQIRGGEDESRELEERLLQNMGHEVEVYEENNDRVSTINAVNLAVRTVWSTEAFNIVKQKLRDKAFDIVHVPVIAANIGAIAELVEHGRTGLHFQPGNAADLAAQVEWVLQHQREWELMRQEARAEYEAKYTAQQNYHRLMEIYALVRPI